MITVPKKCVNFFYVYCFKKCVVFKLSINLIYFLFIGGCDNVYIFCHDDVMVLISSAMDRRFDITDHVKPKTITLVFAVLAQRM